MKINNKIIVLVGMVIITVLVGGVYYFRFAPENFPQKLEFADGKVIVSFVVRSDSEFYPADLSVYKEDANHYILNKEANVSLSISYHKSKNDWLARSVFKRDSDGNAAGIGCYYKDQKKISIGKYQFTELFCYYNYIDSTKSGTYDPNVSSLAGNDYIYEFNNKGILVFGFYSAPVGSDIKYFMTEIGSSLDIKTRDN